MLVCLCRGVSDRKIREVVRQGAQSVEDVGRACQAGTCCGSCQGMIEGLLERNTPVEPRQTLVGIGDGRTDRA